MFLIFYKLDALFYTSGYFYIVPYLISYLDDKTTHENKISAHC